MKKRYLLLSKLLLLLLCPLFSNAQFDPGHVYKIVSRLTGQAIEIGGNDRYQQSHPANLWGYWGGANQQWIIQAVPSQPGFADAFNIVNRNSKQLLEIANARNCSIGACAGSIASQNFRQTIGQASPDPVQSWRFNFDAITGSYRINLVSNGLPLTVGPNNSVYIAQPYGYSAFDYQLWDIVDVSVNPFYDPTLGVYEITNVHSGKALTASPDDFSIAQITNYGLANQQWTFIAGPSADHFTFINRNLGQALEIENGATIPGSRVMAGNNSGYPWQEWIICDAYDPSDTPPYPSPSPYWHTL